MRLHIVRHGQTDWNAVRRIQGQLDSQLDETGEQQALERGTDFQSIELAAVYSSSSLRTRQTTERILEGRKRHEPITYRDDLREVKLGVWQGQYWADIEQQYPELVDAHAKASPDFEVEGAEKSHEVQQRGVSAIESIIAAHEHASSDGNILIVSHGAIMKTILAYYADVALSELHTLPHLPNCAHCTIVVNGSRRIVERIAGEALALTPWANASNLSARSAQLGST
jgi:broad specificity phosphatase PhoE